MSVSVLELIFTLIKSLAILVSISCAFLSLILKDVKCCKNVTVPSSDNSEAVLV